MRFQLPGIIKAKRLRQGSVVPKGRLAVYVGEKKKRFVIPISYLNQPLFRDLLSLSEEAFGYYHPAGGLTFPCHEDIFIDLVSRLTVS